MFSSITSLFGWLSSSNSNTQVTVKEGLVADKPQDGVKPVIVSQAEITNQLVESLKKFQNCSYEEALSRKDTIFDTYLHVHKELLTAVEDNCHRVAIHYFAHHLSMDPTITMDENRWDKLFEKIEGCIRKSLEEIVRCCSKAILAGYYIDAGMPPFLAKIYQLDDPIYFGDPSKHSKPSDYLIHLLLIAQERIPNFIEMQHFDSKVLHNLKLANKKPFEGVTLSLSVYLKDKVLSISTEILKENTIK